ncbi:MAG: phosphopantetheine-binding protein [Verrucomicrobiota bacterium]
MPPLPDMIQPPEIEAELLVFLRRDIFAPETKLDSETDLVAAGFDSMSLVKLLLHVETKYGKWIPEGKITNEALANIRALAATVARVLNEK